MKKLYIEIRDIYKNIIKQFDIETNLKSYYELIKDIGLNPLNYIVFDKEINDFVSENNIIDSSSIILYNTNGQIG